MKNLLLGMCFSLSSLVGMAQDGWHVQADINRFMPMFELGQANLGQKYEARGAFSGGLHFGAEQSLGADWLCFRASLGAVSQRTFSRDLAEGIEQRQNLVWLAPQAGLCLRAPSGLSAIVGMEARLALSDIKTMFFFESDGAYVVIRPSNRNFSWQVGLEFPLSENHRVSARITRGIGDWYSASMSDHASEVQFVNQFLSFSWRYRFKTNP